MVFVYFFSLIYAYVEMMSNNSAAKQCNNYLEITVLWPPLCAVLNDNL